MTTTTQSENEQYLHVISIFHYIVGALAGLFASFPIIHFAVGVGLIMMSLSRPAESGPGMIFGLFFAGIAGMIILMGWTYAICTILAGRFIAGRRRYMFCLVMAGVECMFTPFGTVLGVFTLILLLRPEVKTMFGVPVVTAPTAPAM